MTRLIDSMYDHITFGHQEFSFSTITEDQLAHEYFLILG